MCIRDSFISKLRNQNLPIPMNQKFYNTRNRIKDKGVKWLERCNRTHKLVEFKVGDIILIRSNPVGKRTDNTAKSSLDYTKVPMSCK